MEAASVAIVGAGPIGLEVHWALRKAGVPVLHFDAGQVGATMEWWAPGTRFFSSPERIGICGVPLVTRDQEKASREEYLSYLRGVVAQFELPVRTFERVVAIEPGADGGFLLRTRAAGLAREYHAAKVVVAIGDMHRPRLIGVPGEGLDHVSHYFREPHRYFGRRVLIVGGKNSAVEAAVRCWRVGARVTISYRKQELDAERVKYWLLPEVRWLIKEGHIGWLPGTVVKEIRGHTVRLAECAGGAAREVEADEVLLLTGYEMDGSLLEAAGVELVGEQRAPKFNPRTMETNVPGLYVAGTAVAGTQSRFRWFIENCHVHAERIAGHVTGREVEVEDRVEGMPES